MGLGVRYTTSSVRMYRRPAVTLEGNGRPVASD